jgi:hypothetical protein
MSNALEEKIELVETVEGSLPIEDRRPRMAQPIPVRLIAVEDARLPSIAGLESRLEWFYAELLGFQREPLKPGIVYRAENLRVHFEVRELPAARKDFRPLGIEVPSLLNIERLLIENEIEFEVQKGLTPGQRSLLLIDPGGNWVALSEAPPVR